MLSFGWGFQIDRVDRAKLVFRRATGFVFRHVRIRSHVMSVIQYATVPSSTSGANFILVGSANQPISNFRTMVPSKSLQWPGLLSSPFSNGFDHKMSKPPKSDFGANLARTGSKILSKRQAGRCPTAKPRFHKYLHNFSLLDYFKNQIES